MGRSERDVDVKPPADGSSGPVKVEQHGSEETSVSAPFADTSAQTYTQGNAASLKATSRLDTQGKAAGVPDLTLVSASAPETDAPQHPQGDVTRHSEKAALDPLEQFKKDTGVQVVNVDGNFQYVMNVMGADLPLFQTEPTAEGLALARRQLQEMARTKEAEITKDFKVTFGAAGEVADRQYHKNAAGQWVHDGPELKCRDATLPELYGVQYALRRAEPSQLTNGGAEGVKFYFLEQQHWKGMPPVLAEHGEDLNGHASIFVEPKLYQDLPATEYDSDIKAAEAKVHGRFQSMEEVIVHELSHNAQANVRWNELGPGRTQTPAEFVASTLGWVAKDPKNTSDANGWYLEGKDGYLYKLTEQVDGKWIRYDQHGKPVDAAGHVVSSARQAAHLDSEQMQDVAKVTPPTQYFDNPAEEFAETLTRFRLSDDTKQRLANENPDAYALAAQFDQYEINCVYGLGKDGKPNYVRAADGAVVQNPA